MSFGSQDGVNAIPGSEGDSGELERMNTSLGVRQDLFARFPCGFGTVKAQAHEGNQTSATSKSRI